MKKLISLIITLIISVSCFQNLAFADNPSVEITGFNHDNVTGVVTIEGKVNHKRGEIPLVLTVEKDGQTIWGADGKTTSVTEGNTFTFDSFKFIDKMTTGTYKFTVFAKFVNESASTDIGYVPNSTWYNIIKAVNDNIKSESVDKNTAHITENVLYTELNTEKYMDLSDNAKKLISKMTMKQPYTIPDKWEDTQENMQILSTAIGEFKALCKDGFVYSELYDVYKENDAKTTKTLFDSWFDANKTVFELEADTLETENLDEKVFMTQAFKANYDKLSFYARLPEVASSLDKKDVKQGFVDALILSYVDECENGNELYGFIGDYSDYIGISYGDADSDEIGYAYSVVAGNFYNTLSSFKDALEAELPTDGGGSSGGGSTTSNKGSVSIGGSTGVVTGAVNVDAIKPETSDEAPFTDLESHAWAREAIDFLYRRSVISGRDELTFDPQGNVTRAEFIKMLVSAYNFTDASLDGTGFKDVSMKDWFESFVLKAQAKGIITGDQYGCFNPYASITREDMAVMVYRASSFPEATESIAFVDSGDISSYALSAVSCLYENGVVAGIGDMVFAPKKSVTRAEAAQILYNVLIETIK